MKKVILLISTFLLLFLVSACAPTEVVVVTATPSGDATPTQEVDATLVPTATDPYFNCTNPAYSDSFCPINDGELGGSSRTNINIYGDETSMARSYETFRERVTLDIPDDARNTYNGYIKIDLSWFSGDITLTDVLTTPTQTGSCYIVRVPYSTNLPVALSDEYRPGDFDLTLRVSVEERALSNTNDGWVKAFDHRVVRGDGEALWVVRSTGDYMPTFEVAGDIQFAKFVTGAYIEFYAIEWFEEPCGDYIYVSF
jgi:hypothetical protein